MGYELSEQFDWELPDVVIYPTGGALGAIAIFKAFDELRGLGWVDCTRSPRLVVTQYEGCAPIVKAFKEGREDVESWGDPDVLPGGLKSPRPAGGRAVLRILHATEGTAIAVSTADALENMGQMARTQGVLPCPESATALAGLISALEKGALDRDERIVLMNTGSGLKSIPNMPVADPVSVGPGDDLIQLEK